MKKSFVVPAGTLLADEIMSKLPISGRAMPAQTWYQLLGILLQARRSITCDSLPAMNVVLTIRGVEAPDNGGRSISPTEKAL